jgi:hypothetical protein
MKTPALVKELDPTALPFGTKVGAWSVYGIQGRGTYGTVYRAVNQERKHLGPVALKLAVYPGDPRFEREAELLSRIRHPSVPRLFDAGVWQAPLGGAHPFVVMEWIEGEPLYVWASRRNPSSREVLALLAQATGALQATHEVSAVHRDVKGDNMVVRSSDGRLFLTDFGAGYFTGATRLTPPHMLPGTPEYRSLELWESTRHATVPALARPWDDVFALGVTAYRLVTDTYPPLPLTDMKAGECWLPGGKGAPPPRQLNPRVDTQLSALISRMLSLRPEERGTALELVEAMERGVAHAPPAADAHLFEWETLRPSQWTQEELADAEHLGHRLRRRNRQWVPKKMRARSWLSWLAAAMALGLGSNEAGSVRTGAQLTAEHRGSEAPRRAVSLGDTALSAPTEQAQALTEEPIAQEMPKQPLPGQRKPDSKGRCPTRQVAINGACWTKLDVDPEDCRGNVYVYQGGCYFPMFTRGREPTSAPRQQ